MKNKFDRFITFGSIADKDKRAEIAALIYEQLQKKQNVSITLSNEDTGNFTSAIENILSNETMRELCAKDQELAEHITTNILDFINKTRREIQREEIRFENEQKLIDNFEQTTEDSFDKSWEVTASFIKETYPQNIDTEFYYEEFQKSLSPQKTDKNNISFQSVKEHFTGKWGGLFFQEKLKWELDIIEKERKKFCEELYAQIEQLKKLQKLLEPFMGELGRLWDMSKGRWQKVNFDILENYAKLLQQDKSLQELAEMLGRMRQAEREYEEEIFAKPYKKPAWKAEHAARSELVGIHESDDISSMLPAEAALLADEITELLFYKKFAEKKLQTFEYQSKVLYWEEEEIKNKRQKEKEETKGPFIICVDTSGSMEGAPETIAKTLCFSILKMAVRNNRKCYLILFSTDTESKSIDLMDFKNNLIELIEFLSMSFHGGTDVTKAMQKALEMLKTENYKKADVIVVSDFVMDDLEEETIRQISDAKEDETKFYSLVIGDSGNKNTIEEFDSNWAYNTNNRDCVLQLVRYIYKSLYPNADK
jgi:uncharacterized protein with von Willebrand factor type A (vWA) domain